MKSKVKTMKILSYVLKLESELIEFQSSRTRESLDEFHKEEYEEKVVTLSGMIRLLRKLDIPYSHFRWVLDDPERYFIT